MAKLIAPYGSWMSPINTDFITAQTVSLKQNYVDGEDIYWIESRPREEGRYVVMRRTPDGDIRECTAPDYYVRSRVHEYGGGAYAASEGVIYFCNFKDQHLYRQPVGGVPELLTPQDGSLQNAHLVTGSPSESIVQPGWSPEGALYFVAEHTG